jgi:hypothetical protein
MQSIVKFVYFTTLAIWVGGIACFSFLVAPALFGTLPSNTAGDAVGAIFPRYYAAGYVCGFVLLAVCALLYREAGTQRWWRVSTALFTVMLLATLYAGMVTLPRTAALRPQIRAAEVAPEVRAEFGRLHGIAMGLNVLVLVCGLTAIGLGAGRLRW